MTRSVAEWALTDAGNNFDVADGGMPEGQPRKSVNNSTRERMRALRQLYDTGMEWLDLMRNPTDQSAFVVSRLSATEIRIASGATDMSSYFNVGRALQTLTAAAVTDSPLFVLSVVYSNPNTDVTIFTADGDAVTAGIDQVLLHAAADLGRLAFDSTIDSDFVVPADYTDAAFAAALTAAAASNRIVLLQTGTYALTQSHTIPQGVQIWGRGIQASGGSILRVDDGADVSEILKLSTGCALRNLAIDGNKANQTAGTGHGLDFAFGPILVAIEDVLVTQIRGDAIRNGGAAMRDCVFDRVHVLFPDGYGFLLTDPSDTLAGQRLSNILVEGCGTGVGINDSAAIAIAGEGVLSNITIRSLNSSDGSKTQRGIWFLERLAASTPFDGARGCTLSGFRIEGTGQNVRGVQLAARNCAVTGGAIDLTGSVSRGVVVGGSGAQELPEKNVVGDVTIRNANVGVLLQGTATKNKIDVSVSNCNIGVIVQGDSNRISGHYHDMASHGINVQSGADENVVQDCVLEDIVGDGVRLDLGAGVNNIVWPNRFRSITGFNLNVVSALGSVEYQGDTLRRFALPTGTPQTIETFEFVVAGMGGIAFPIPTNSSRRFRVSVHTAVRSQGNELTLRLRKGLAGGLGDAVVAFKITQRTSPSDTTVYEHSLKELVVTPAAEELLTVSQFAFSNNTGRLQANGYDPDLGLFGLEWALFRSYLEIEYLDG